MAKKPTAPAPKKPASGKAPAPAAAPKPKSGKPPKMSGKY